MTTVDPFGLAGQVLDGQFRVDRVVGEGGFSVVYKGFHLGLDEPIAVKCLKLPGSLGSALVESFVRRFRDESRIHYKLSQGNLYIARSIASGTTMAPITGALVPYMVLEWLEGRSLAEDFAMRRAHGMRGRPLPEVMKLLDPALDALAHAHAQGVVHRDLNPGNLFLATTQGGTKIKVLDFGVAKVVSDHALEMGPRAQTIGQIRIFSPAYGSPEQFDDKIGKVGPWSDVYSIALIILEALRDHGVNEGEHIGEFAMRALDANERPTPRSLGVAVGDEVEALMTSAVAIDPNVRPRDAGDFWGQMKNAVRKDSESGRTSYAQGRSASVAPPRGAAHPLAKTLPAPTPSPAVEVSRAQSSAPRASAPQRPVATTLRMSNAPSRPDIGRDEPTEPAQKDMRVGPSGAQALAATPGTLAMPPVPHLNAWGPQTPVPQLSPRPPSAAPPPRTATPPPPRYSAPAPPGPSGQWSSGSSAQLRPPPAPEEDVDLPRSNTRKILLLSVVFFVLLGAIAYAGYYFVLRRSPARSSPDEVGSRAGETNDRMTGQHGR